MSAADGTRLVLGVDGGGTKTLACVADLDGRVRGVGRAAGSNFQIHGIEGARASVAHATAVALEEAGAGPERVEHACYGLSGADRARDFEHCRDLLAPIRPVPEPGLVNDTQIALRAGTLDGVGIALVAGTGSNALGVNAGGRLHRVGGLDPLLGDYGGARDLVERATSAAMRGHDGRGEPTILYERLTAALGLDELVDLIEACFHESLRRDGIPHLGTLAPVVFEAARDGDAVAIGILRDAGAEAALCANLILRALFEPGERVPIVLGGSLYQRGRSDEMLATLESNLDPAYGGARIEMLDVEPVLGGVLYALDEAHGGLAPAELRETLTGSWRARAEGRER